MFGNIAENEASKYSQRTENYFHNQYNKKEDLASAMGPGSVSFGIRPLDLLQGFAFDTDLMSDLDMGLFHENVFITDGGGALYNYDYSSKGILPDKNFPDNISNYRFSDAYHGYSTQTLFAATHPAGFTGSNYRLMIGAHNCQVYSDTVQWGLNIPSWHS